MSKPGLILIGAGGHAHACIDVIEQYGGYNIAGLIGMPDELHDHHLGYTVIGTDDDLFELAKTIQYALITLGQIKTPAHRIRLYEQVVALGFQLPTIMAPSAYVSPHATLGAGTIVMHGAIVNAGASVGKNCIINTRALLEHDAAVADHCHISTGAILNGNTAIGSGSFVGSGCIVKQGVSLGRGCVVGMGFTVRHNQPDYALFARHKKS
ncbi:acetyltransferase [Rhodoferax sp.]|uniref:acetyltransferase n=1 Tax=Rhodoferax sp. TaxID=50421 RepID=UPI0008AFDE02|nr:acetyltransferase [Rhodoferax sp.]MDO8319250.1 acetyltransferase [Rhodoferax sp.]OGB39542.1 MAG: acetyltransferase [Burkholderiales bacterium RIFOXYC2_FULL_59_8]OGB50078.1 MAG: acetyltransferase [Burkholderiales bacterium RIFOXYD12_FULL_59_19]OGB76996.1 MAG: acetyltransferase [Burkholderiales bacterium RIFOXYC12_FULL_60_6]